MAENSCINMIMNIPNTFNFNREAHTSRQLLHRRSSDEDNGDEGDDDDEETETEEEQKNDEVKELEEDSGDDTLIIESNNDHLNHSTSAPEISSSPSFPFHANWGRGSSSISTVLLLNFFFG